MDLEDQGRLLFDRNIVTGMTSAITSNLRDTSEPKPTGVLHDAWYIYVGALVGFNGGLIQAPLVKYRQHAMQQYGALRNKGYSINNMISNMPDVIRLNLKVLIPLIDNKEESRIRDNRASIYLSRKIAHFERRSTIYKNISRAKKIYYFSLETFNYNYFRFGNIKTWLVDFCSITFFIYSDESNSLS